MTWPVLPTIAEFGRIVSRSFLLPRVPPVLFDQKKNQQPTILPNTKVFIGEEKINSKKQ